MNIRVIRKDITKARLTVANDEVRVKIPPAVTDEHAARIVMLAEKVAARLYAAGPLTKTFRTSFKVVDGKYKISPQDADSE